MLDLFGCTLLDSYFLLIFTISVLSLAGMNTIEEHLPIATRQILRYGKYAYKGKPSHFVARFEFPKSLVRHFYIFAAMYATIGIALLINVYFRGNKTPEMFINLLDFVNGPYRTVKGKS